MTGPVRTVGAHRPATASADQESSDNPRDSATATMPTRNACSPGRNQILDSVIDFAVDQRRVAPLAEGEAVHDQPSVGMICEN